MLFYRVCHRELLNSCEAGWLFHAGPYTVGDSVDEWPREIQAGLKEMNHAHNKDRKHLSVAEEWHFRFPFGGDFLCGFTSPEKLAEWFAGFFEVLYEAGYIVRVWDVPPHFISEGEIQSVARLDFLALSKPLKKMDLAEFEKSLGKVLA